MAHSQPLRTFHLFAGAGGGMLADILLGHLPVGACEIEEYPRHVLLARMRDGILPVHPVWDDINTLDGKPWRGLVDVVCGGFPCQDISAAGKGAGIDGERSGLWGEMARIIREIRPRFAFVENSPMLTSRGLHRVLGDLAEMGYDARWCVLGACDAGAPHKRDRIWILATLADASVHGQLAAKKRKGTDERSDYCTTGEKSPGESSRLCAAGEYSEVADADGARQQQGDEEIKDGSPKQSDCVGIQSAELGNACNTGLQGGARAKVPSSEGRDFTNGYFTESSGLWWEIDPATLGDAAGLDCENDATKPVVGRVAHGVAHRVDRLKAIGNGQVPQCAALAWRILNT